MFSQKNLSKAIINRIKKLINCQGDVHLYEFGVGILSKNILDYLADEYAHVVLHISDISPQAITSIQSLKVFHNHEKHISYEVMDASSPNYVVKPDFVFHSYLVDSLPTNHFEVNESGENI